MTDAENERRAAEDAFARASLNLPLDHKLRSMSYISLCDLLASFPSGSTQYIVVDAEKRRRDAVSFGDASKQTDAIQNLSADHPAQKPDQPYQWGHRFIGLVWVASIGGAVAALIIYLIKTYGGVPL